MQQNVLAIVTRAVNYRDHDRILTLITRDGGRMTITARGCRKAQSKFLTCSQQFCYGEYELYDRDGHLYVRQCDVREIFYDLRMAPDALAAATYACQVCEMLAVPAESFAKGFSMLLHTLKALCEADCDIDAILAFFLIKQMSFAGLCPQADACVCCASTDNLRAFSAEYGGAVCAQCQAETQGSIPISAVMLQTIKELPNVPSAAYDSIHQSIKPLAARLYSLLEASFSHFTGQELPTRTFIRWPSQ